MSVGDPVLTVPHAADPDRVRAFHHHRLGLASGSGDQLVLTRRTVPSDVRGGRTANLELRDHVRGNP